MVTSRHFVLHPDGAVVVVVVVVSLSTGQLPAIITVNITTIHWLKHVYIKVDYAEFKVNGCLFAEVYS